MFSGSRRHRPPITSQASVSTNPNAATAASAAFMAASNQNPNRALSSAAAAAALRARPHTPIDVGAVETKRTQRRSASVSSHGSGRYGQAQAGQRQGRVLERQPSSGSMTERTFRTPSPSPHRSAALAPIAPEPPVPQIPANHRKTQSAASQGVGMQTFRTASQKMAAKPTSYYTQSQGNTGNVRTSDAAMRPRASVVHDQFEPPARSESRSSSVNYSYPSGYRPQSPPGSPTFHRNAYHEDPAAHAPISPPRSSRTSAASSAGSRAEPALVYDPNSRRMVPAPQPANIEYNMRQEANRQTSKKKKDQGVGRSGSHLAKGTMGRAKGTAVDNYSKETQRSAPVTESRMAAQEPEPVQHETYVHEHEDHGAHPKNQQPRQSHFEEVGLSDTDTPIEPPILSAPERLTSPPPIRSVSKKPSMVREEPEEDEEDVPEVITPLSQKVLHAVEASPSQAIAAEAHAPLAAEPESEDELESDAEPEFHASTAADVPRPSENFANERPGSFVENKPVSEVVRTASRRNDSISPDRRARFGPAEQLTVRHHPPGRSASPIKSAMKRSGGSSRDVSPSEHGSEGQAAAAIVSDPVAARKKAVRVSFDERSNVIMGESAGDSAASSPQSKRPWYSSLGRKKRDVALEEDEVMKPRPALPSFGSVREKKARGETAPEERPLIRPSDAMRPAAEPITGTIRTQSPEVPTYRTVEEQARLESSSDHAIGSVLSHDLESRNEANTSRFREPLPPVVTSIEGNGYHMDTTTDESDNDLLDQSMTLEDDASPVTSTHTTQPIQDEQFADVEDKVLIPTDTAARRVEQPAQPVPEIAVILPSPMANEETPKATASQRKQYFEVPGGFPTEDSSDSAKNTAQTTPAEPVMEPEPAVHPAQVSTLPQTSIITTGLNAVPAQNDTSESESESIYSDAYEDLSDMEGGFASIDAIVESPVTHNASPPSSQAQSPTIPSKTVSIPQPAGADEDEKIVKNLPTKAATSPIAGGQDWSQAETFWRSLTAEKRQQLAKEYIEDEGIDGDREEVSTPIRRNSSRRKSAEKKQILAAAEKQAQPAATKAVAKESNSEPDPERTYMIQPGSKAKHNVPASQESIHMRKSLRGNQPSQTPASGAPAAAKGSLRKSMRGTPEPQAQAPAPTPSTRTLRQRPTTSSDAPSSQTNGAKSSATGLVDTKAASAALAKQMMPKMTRRGSDASDSSFQRTRRPASSAGFGLRGSMRGAPPPRNQAAPPPPREQAPKGSGRWSLRSLSPPAALRRDSSNISSSPAQGGMMRQSLRTNSQDSVPKRNSLHLPFGKSSKSSSIKEQKRSSRFAGSSDEEDDVRPSGFRSRFDNSSDEEDVRPGSSSQGSALSRGSLRSKPAASSGAFRKTTTPVLEEPESPDLPDSDDDDPFRSSQRPSTAMPALATARPGEFSRTNSGNIGTSALRRSGSGRGNFVTTVSADSPTSPIRRERRGSFMGSILRRNKKADQAGKIQRSEFTESAARRDTRLERDADALRELRAAEERPTSPRSQKKHFFGRKREDSWPLPEEEEEAATAARDKAAEAGAPSSPIFQRPSSSNGKLTKNITGLNQRPNFSGRRSTSLGLPGIPETNGNSNGVPHSSQRAFDQDSVAAMSEPGVPKKKKFGSLRRIFGLTG